MGFPELFEPTMTHWQKMLFFMFMESAYPAAQHRVIEPGTQAQM